MTTDTIFYKTTLPIFSLAENSFNRIDYKDAYGCEFRSPNNIRVEDAVMAFFKSPSPVLSGLFKLRNQIMKPFGLKVSDSSDREQKLREFKVEKGEALGLFKVIDKSDNEVLIGEDDKHLNFRISFFLTKNIEAPGHYRFVLSTTVLFHNHFGKLYFLPVKPVHKLIVPNMVRSIVKQLSSN